ncbi:predicted hydrolase or acyltransferase [Rothia mucilaginosa DY-18]|uniref:Predicted hydrolase or acyltransferase n=1 Tax=Rothia mucilaginosa (strain DY-18) TaxID=680646 RepID=D2NSS8_ROTMD|nr:predicted hydrolase or acyltransferase [Rothia mucilaginosa DY-18]
MTLLGEGLSLHSGACRRNRAFVVQHVAAFTHEAHPLAGQFLKLLSGQRTGGDVRLIGGGAGGNVLMPQVVHFVGVAVT